MSARDELISWFGGEHTGTIEVHLDEYAHELAEKIRTAKRDKLMGFYGSEMHAYLEGESDAADLIDPEVAQP